MTAAAFTVTPDTDLLDRTRVTDLRENNAGCCQVVWDTAAFGHSELSPGAGRSGGESQLGDLIPHPESGGEFGAVGSGAHAVPGWAEVRGDPTERSQKPLR